MNSNIVIVVVTVLLIVAMALAIYSIYRGESKLMFAEPILIVTALAILWAAHLNLHVETVDDFISTYTDSSNISDTQQEGVNGAGEGEQSSESTVPISE